MEVVINVGNAQSQILGLDNIKIVDAISYSLSYILESAKFSWAARQSGWDGRQRLLGKTLKFPSGLLARVKKVLDSFNLQYTVNDQRNYSELKKPSGLVWNGPSLYDHQNKVIDVALDKKTGLIQACTGFGKSNVIARIIYEYNLPSVVYVISLDLLSQMKDTLSACLNIPIGMVGNGVCDIQRVTVCSAWSAEEDGKNKEKNPDKWTPNQIQKHKISEMVAGAKLILLDEAHSAGSNTIKSILSRSVGASHRYGLSGTAWREDGAQILLEAAFGDKICDIKSSDLIDLGFLVPPQIYFRDIPSLSVKVAKNWPAVKKTYIANNEERNKIIIGNTLKLLEKGRKV